MTQGVAQAWLVLKLTGSGLDLGLLGACYMLPVLAGGPWAGTLVDRFDRRRLLIATQSLFIVAAALMTALTSTGAVRVWMLFVVAFVTGAVSAPDGAARQVYVLDLVGGSRLAGAISLNEVVLNVSRVVGPAVGGVFLATLGIPVCYLANGVSYIPPLLVLLIVHRQAAMLRRDRTGASRSLPAAPTQLTRRTARGGVRAGLAYVWRTPLLRTAILMAAASGMLFNLGVALPLLATRVFALGGGGYGLMMAAFGLGGVVGALLAAVVRERLHLCRQAGRLGAGRPGGHRLPLDLVHRPCQHPGSAPLRPRHAGTGDGHLDHGAARRDAGDRPGHRAGRTDAGCPGRLRSCRSRPSDDDRDRLAGNHRACALTRPGHPAEPGTPRSRGGRGLIAAATGRWPPSDRGPGAPATPPARAR